MIVLGFDTETTGLNVKEDRIIEVGAMLYDTETRSPLRIFNTFVRPEPPLPEGYISPTGILGEDLTRHGVSLPDAFGEIQRMTVSMEPAIVIAHNGTNFDKPITLSELERHKIVGHGLMDAHWIDSRLDLPFKKEPKSRSLTHLAADHGFLNPFEHRALFDVCTMMKLLDHYDFNEVYALSKIPLITIRACTDYAQRQLAKDARFNWDGEKKIWAKNIRENAFEREEAQAAEKGFKIVKL
jgi:DNA polymerase III epsilon subunit-like protein